MLNKVIKKEDILLNKIKEIIYNYDGKMELYIMKLEIVLIIPTKNIDFILIQMKVKGLQNQFRYRR